MLSRKNSVLPVGLRVVTVKETYEIIENVPGTNHASGLMVIFDARQSGGDIPAVGSQIEFIRPDGEWSQVKVLETNKHGHNTHSIFFADWQKKNVPVGSIIFWMSGD